MTAEGYSPTDASALPPEARRGCELLGISMEDFCGMAADDIIRKCEKSCVPVLCQYDCFAPLFRCHSSLSEAMRLEGYLAKVNEYSAMVLKNDEERQRQQASAKEFLATSPFGRAKTLLSDGSFPVFRLAGDVKVTPAKWDQFFNRLAAPPLSFFSAADSPRWRILLGIDSGTLDSPLPFGGKGIHLGFLFHGLAGTADVRMEQSNTIGGEILPAGRYRTDSLITPKPYGTAKPSVWRTAAASVTRSDGKSYTPHYLLDAKNKLAPGDSAVPRLLLAFRTLGTLRPA